MTDVAGIVGGHRPLAATVRITLRGDLRGVITSLASEYERMPAQHGLNDRSHEIVSELEARSLEMAESEVEFLFQGISRAEYKRLMALCPPTPSQAKAGEVANSDDWEPTFIAACSVTPKLSTQDVRVLDEHLSVGQFGKLIALADYVNSGDDEAPKFVTPFVEEDSDEMSSDSRLNGESPEVSSSDE